MRDLEVPNTWKDKLDGWVGTRREVIPVVAIIAVVVVAASLLWLRPASSMVAPPATAAAPVSAPILGATPSVSPTGAVVFVHVGGLVRKPGLYQLAAGARVADAIESAGGFRSAAWIDGINLAEIVVDGSKIEVPRRGEAVVSAPTTSAGETGATVAINTADALALETIPGVGPVTAAAILRHRDEAGPFTSIDQLLDVSGIGPATLESIRPYISL